MRKRLALGALLSFTLAVHAQDPPPAEAAKGVRLDLSQLEIMSGSKPPAHGGSEPDADSTLAADELTSSAAPAAAIVPIRPESEPQGVQWKSVTYESLRFLAVQHGFRLWRQDYTRDALKGRFLDEWGRSIANLRGWSDGDSWKVNYVGHPIQGAVSGYIFVHNDPKGAMVEIGKSRAYWMSRVKAIAFSAAYSAQFEIGPLGEAAIGNVGLDPKDIGWTDLVATPVGGMAWVALEDAADKWVVQTIERKFESRVAKAIARGVFNPSRSFANVLRGKLPWHRDTRPGLFQPAEPIVVEMPAPHPSRSSD